MKYPPKHQRRTNNPFYEKRPSNENTTSSLPKTNNQTIDDAKYKFDNIINIYDKFRTLQENNVLVIIKPEHIRKTLPNGAIIIDEWIEKMLIVKYIIPSEEKYFPKNRDHPLYLTVYYYENMDSLTRIANGETIEPLKTILPYRMNMNNGKTNEPQIYDPEIPSPNEGTEYKNGIFINDYILQHHYALEQKEDYKIQEQKHRDSSPSAAAKRRTANNTETKKTTPTSSDLINTYGSKAAAVVAILLAMYYMFNQKGGELSEFSKDSNQLSEFSKDKLEALLKELNPTLEELNTEISKLDVSEKEIVKKEIKEYFPGFNLEEGETVFGSLFGKGGKRRRTNKKRKTNKRRNNKKKSNRR